MGKYSQLFLLTCILVLGTVFSYAADSPVGSLKQNSPPAALQEGQPSISFPEASFDFGEVSEGSEVSHDFVVKNTGTTNLEINRVQPG